MKNNTKRNTLTIGFLIVTIALSLSAEAQSEFGLKGGALYSGFQNNNCNSDRRVEWVSGVSAGIFYKKNNIFGPIGFQSELLYQMKGAYVFLKYPGYCTPIRNPYGSGGYSSYGYGTTNDPAVPWLRNKTRLHYLVLPLLFTFSAVHNVDVFAGPEFGYLLSSPESNIIVSEPHEYSVGLAAGVAIKLSGSTSLDIRYTHDFSTIYAISGPNYKNQNITVTLQKTILNKL